MLPAALFFSAIFLRNFIPATDPANAPQHVVMWYAGRPWTLWVLLTALPLSSLVLGGGFLLRSWTGDAELRQDTRQVLGTLRAQLPVVVSAVVTAVAAVALALIALHMAAD